MGGVADRWEARYRRLLNPLTRVFLILATTALTFIGVYLLVALAGQTLRVEVPDQLLLVAEAMVLLVFLTQASVVADNEHIRVDVLAERLSNRTQGRLDMAGHLFGVIFYGLLAIAGLAALLWAVRTGAYQMGLLAVPEWITRLAFVLGALLALIRSVCATHLSFLGRGAP